MPSAGRLSLQLDARYRYHAEAARRYSRVGPRLGVQCTDALSLTVDYLVLDVDEKNRSELGLTVWYEPERPLAVDGSVRLQLIDGEPSYYTDGFVSWVAPQAGISAGAGVFVQGQQSGSYVDTAVGGLARVTWRLHGG